MLCIEISERGINMKKRDLIRWAAMSNILETAAVVASLIFVAYTVNRNTAIMQSVNDNFVYQIQDQRVGDIANNSELASIELKVRNNEEVSDLDKHRMISQHVREINMWELAFVRYNEGLYSSSQWLSWDRYYALDLTAKLPQEWWTEVKGWYGDDFAEHVDAAYAIK
jgi:hypothetical protein